MPNVVELDRTHAIVAPGQASQGIGKGLGLYLNSEAARAVWQQTDQLLGFSFSDLALHGIVNGVQLEPNQSKAELTKTENAQPAVIVTSLAALATLEELGVFGDKYPYWHSGHSVGLIAGLVTSGALDAKKAVELGDARRKAFKLAIDNGPKGGTGFLAVQNDKPEMVIQYVEDLTTRFPLTIALDNYDNQVVLAGEKRVLDEAIGYVQAVDPRMAGRLNRFPVEAAYHSDFMLPAVETYAEAVDKIDIQVPTRGVLVAGSMVDDDGTVRILETVADIKTALVRQLTHPERWRQVMRFLHEQGVTRMTELNQDPSLASWNRRMFEGERSSIVLPGVKNSEGKDIDIAWDWRAPAPVEAPVETEVLVLKSEPAEGELDLANEEVERLLVTYNEIAKKAEENPDVDAMETFLALPGAETFGGMVLWYSNWAALRWFKPLEIIKPDDDFTRAPHINGDSLDYEVLRADVDGVYKSPVDAEEAQDRTTARKMATATWEKRKALLDTESHTMHLLLPKKVV